MKKLEALLEESSYYMERALSKSRVIITCQDADLRYIWVFNPLRGYDNTIGKKIEDFGTDEHVNVLVPLKREVLRTKRAVQKTLSFDIDGRMTTFDMTVAPNFENGRVIGLTTISVDITDLLAAQEEMQQAHARLLGMLGDGVVHGKVKL